MTTQRTYIASFGMRLGCIDFEVVATSTREAEKRALLLLPIHVTRPEAWSFNGVTLQD